MTKARALEAQYPRPDQDYSDTRIARLSTVVARPMRRNHRRLGSSSSRPSF